MSLIYHARPSMAALAAGSRMTLPILRRVAPFNNQIQGQRYASVKAQGAYKQKSKRGIPKKLGAKRTGDQWVIPGNILYKQRGSLWWPGENCIMGRDHTIHAMASGYVKYYRDPKRHPDRKYIGVVFNKEDVLPYPEHAERKRRLNMLVRPMKTLATKPELSPSNVPYSVTRIQQDEPDRLLKLRKDYSYREDNWAIGQLAKTTSLKTTRFRTRKQYFRQRRWRKERELEGQRKYALKMKELGDDGTGKKLVSKKQAKKQAKKQVKAKK